MKRIYTILAAVLIAASIGAQSPEKMSYQAVVRDANGDLVVNTQIGMKITILKSLVVEKKAYAETQTPTTNENGLITIEVGTGKVVLGNFSSIDWSKGPYYIRTEIDPSGGSLYTITGTSELISVPYALYAKTAENVSWDTIGNKIYYDGGYVGIGTSVPASDLHISNTESSYITVESDDNTGVVFKTNRANADSYLMGIDAGNNKFRIANTTTDSYPLVIYGDNVGINTLNPTSALHVSTGQNDVDVLNLQTPGIFGGYTWTGVSFSTSLGKISAIRSYADASSNGDIRFLTDNNSGGSSVLVERIRISPNGYLGIGTTTPTAPLHINDFMKLQPRSSAPSNPEKGMVYYDSDDNKLKVYTGSAWEPLN